MNKEVSLADFLFALCDSFHFSDGPKRTIVVGRSSPEGVSSSSCLVRAVSPAPLHSVGSRVLILCAFILRFQLKSFTTVLHVRSHGQSSPTDPESNTDGSAVRPAAAAPVRRLVQPRYVLFLSDNSQKHTRTTFSLPYEPTYLQPRHHVTFRLRQPTTARGENQRYTPV